MPNTWTAANIHFLTQAELRALFRVITRKRDRALFLVYRAYLNSPAERRDEWAAALRRSISRGEIEAANLRDVDTNYEHRILQKRLFCTIELTKASLSPTS